FHEAKAAGERARHLHALREARLAGGNRHDRLVVHQGIWCLEVSGKANHHAFWQPVIVASLQACIIAARALECDEGPKELKAARRLVRARTFNSPIRAAPGVAKVAAEIKPRPTGDGVALRFASFGAGCDEREEYATTDEQARPRSEVRHGVSGHVPSNG